MALLLWFIFLYLKREFNDFLGSFSLSYNMELLRLVLKKLISQAKLIRI